MTDTSQPHAPQTDAEILRAVAIANVPALTMLVYQFTGDERWLDARYAPRRGRGLDDNDSGGLPVATQDEIRAAAGDALIRMERGEAPKIATPPREDMVRLMSFYVGEQVAEEYGEMLATEISLRVIGPPAVKEVPAPAAFHALIIGAGVGGLLAAKLLGDLGVPYVLVEKQEAPGGNWWQNTYPGAGVDTPSHLYSFSFALRDWSQHFERRDAIQRYIADTFDAVGAAPNTRFGTEVVSAIFDEATQKWRVTVRSGDKTEVLTVNAVFSAVGVLNKKKMPDVAGIASFAGRSFHSSDWPADLDLTGKRVAVVGTGATSMQVVPAIADKVGTLTVFQRTPQWVAPFGKFMKPIPEELRWLIAHSPIYRSWYWLRLFWQFGDNVISALKKDPEWAHPERSMNRWNDGHRDFFIKYIEDQLGDRTDLLPKTLPDYPPFGKRILLDNGWFQALRRNNVTLVSDAVASVDAAGLTTVTGEHHDLDVIVWASGFDTTTFLSSLDVRGRGGLALTDAWEKDDPRAYLGMVTPGFPNLFMIGGPQTLPGSGSYMFCVELQIRYLAQVLRWMFSHHAASVDIRPEVNDQYNAKLDEGHANLVWTHPGFTTYYRNSKGRVVFISPFRNVEFWHLTKTPDMSEYEVGERGGRSVNLNYIDLFDRAVRTSRDRLALADDHLAFTYAELQAYTNRLAHTLLDAKMKPGTPFGTLSPNSALAMVSMLGGLRAGGAWCNINLRNALAINIDVLRRGRCEILFFDSSLVGDMAQLKAEVPTLHTLVCLDRSVDGYRSLEELCAGGSSAHVIVRLREDQTGMQGSTGGTTGKAKVVRHGPGFLAMNCFAFMNVFGEVERPVNLAVAPITHAGGIVAQAVLAMGGTVHMMHHADLDELLTKIETRKVSLLFLPPTVIYVLLNHPRTPGTDFSSLRVLLSAAAPFNVEKIALAHKVFGPVVAQSYGQTETGFPLTYMAPRQVTEALANPELAHRLSSCGTMTPNIAGLVALDDEGRVLPPGEVGEIATHGPTRMLEYIDDGEATDAVRSGEWQRTGDLGYVDAEGFVYLNDRKRDLIITGGFNVFPLQVEQALAGHPAVQDSAVIGVPDDKWGEAVKAVVELAPGKTVTEEELIAFCKEGVGSVMAPKSIDFIATLPRSAVGKVLKRELREKYWAGRKQQI